MNKLYIPLVLGTARIGRESEKVAKFVLEVMKSGGDIETELIDVRDYHLSYTQEENDNIKEWREKASRGDGFMIVSPEYNHGYPGELKLFLDSLEKEYHKKPLGICGVSNGGMGGVRMAEMLKLVAITLYMVPIKNTAYFSNAPTLFESDGKIKDKTTWERRVKVVIDEVVWYAKALKEARGASKEL
jgi:NAD(P)H-dependent FMN reductase